MRAVNASYLESSDGTSSLIPLQLYRKISATDQQRVEDMAGVGVDIDEMQKEPMDYTEMRSQDDQVSNASVSIDIKLEPNSLSQSLRTPNHSQQNSGHHHSHLHSSQSQQLQHQQQQQHQHHHHHQQQQQQQHQLQQSANVAAANAASHLEIGTTPLMYQLPQVHPPVSAYATLVQAPNINTLNMTVAAAAAAGQVPTSIAALLPQDLPKDSIAVASFSLSGSAASHNNAIGIHANNVRNLNNNNSNNNTNNGASNHHTTNANNSTLISGGGVGIGGGGGGGSTVSSEDGERWYICDFENCGLKFKYQSRLELHRSVHSKERRFACEVCGASFKQSCNLSTHRKKKHALRGIKSSTILPVRRF